jgi:hypothetical protein
MKKQYILTALIGFSSIAPNLPAQETSPGLLIAGYTSSGLLCCFSTERLLSLIGSRQKYKKLKKILALKNSSARTRAIIYLILSSAGIVTGITVGALTGYHHYKVRQATKPEQKNHTPQTRVRLEDEQPVHELLDGTDTGLPATLPPNPTPSHAAHRTSGSAALESDFPGGKSPKSISSQRSTPPMLNVDSDDDGESSDTDTLPIVSGDKPRSPVPTRLADTTSSSPTSATAHLTASPPAGGPDHSLLLRSTNLDAATHPQITPTDGHTERLYAIAQAVGQLSTITPGMVLRGGRPPLKERPPLGRSKSADSPQKRASRVASTDATPCTTPELTPPSSPARAGAGSGAVAVRSPRFDRLPSHSTIQPHAQHRSTSDKKRERSREKRALAKKETAALHLEGSTPGQLIGQNNFWLKKFLTNQQNALLIELASKKIDLGQFKTVLKKIHQECIILRSSVLSLGHTNPGIISKILEDALEECPDSSLETSLLEASP